MEVEDGILMEKGLVSYAQQKPVSPYKLTEELEHRLQRTNDPVRLIMGVYKEIVPSNKGRTSQGQYHTQFSSILGPKGLQQKLNVDKDAHADIGAFVLLLATKLTKHELPHHVAKLAAYAQKTKLLYTDGEFTAAGAELWERYKPAHVDDAGAYEEDDDDFGDDEEF